MMHVNDLPDDVLFMIVSRLDIPHRIALERVCKKWQLLVARSLLSVKIIAFDEYMLNRKLSKFYLTDDIMQKVLSLCMNAVEIRISDDVHHNLSSKAIDYLSNYGQSLTKVQLTDITGSKSSFKKFAKAHPNMEEIYFSKCEKIEEEAFDWMVHKMPNLKAFILHDYPQFTANCFRRFPVPPCLERLELIKCPNISVRNLAIIEDRCSNLSALVLDDSIGPELLETVLPRILAKSINLKRFVIEYYTPKELGKQSLKALAGLKHLEIVHMHKMTGLHMESDDFRKMCLNNVHLKELSFPHMPYLTDDSFEHFSKLSQLEHLSIICSDITDATLTKISTFNRNLNYLWIGSAEYITSKGCASVLDSCSKLTYVLFDDCPLITIDIVMSAIAVAKTRTANDPFLRLTLSDCSVSSKEVKALNIPENLEVVCEGAVLRDDGHYDFGVYDSDEEYGLYGW